MMFRSGSDGESQGNKKISHFLILVIGSLMLPFEQASRRFAELVMFLKFYCWNFEMTVVSITILARRPMAFFKSFIVFYFFANAKNII